MNALTLSFEQILAPKPYNYMPWSLVAHISQNSIMYTLYNPSTEKVVGQYPNTFHCILPRLDYVLFANKIMYEMNEGYIYMCMCSFFVIASI